MEGRALGDYDKEWNNNQEMGFKVIQTAAAMYPFNQILSNDYYVHIEKRERKEF